MKKEELKKAVGRTIAMLLVTGLCAGCGMQARKPETNDPVKAEKEKKERKELLSELALRDGEGTYVTEHCIYRVKEQAGEKELVQSDWQGKERRRYPLGEDVDIEAISDQYVCYSDLGKNDWSILYIAPIEQTDNGEKVEMDKKEKLAETELEFAVYTENSCVYYILTSETDVDFLYCYDAGKKETKCLLKSGRGDMMQFCGQEYENSMKRLTYGSKIYLSVLEDGGTSLYCIDTDTVRLDALGRLKDLMLEEIWAVKDNLVFCSGGTVDPDDYLTWYFVYDTEQQKKIAELTENQIKTFLKQQGLWKKGADFEVSASRDGGEQLQFVLSFDWPEKITATGGPKKGKEVEVRKSKQILLRCPWRELTALSLDQKLSQWMDEHVDYTDVFVTAPPTASTYSHYNLIPNVAVWNFYGEELLLCCLELEKKDAQKSEEASVDEFYVNAVLKSCEMKAYDPGSGRIRDIPKTDVLYQIASMSVYL